MNTYNLTTTNTAPTASTGYTVVTVTFRQPARTVHTVIPNGPFTTALNGVPAQYRTIVEASLQQAARDILSDYVKGYTVGLLPTTIDSGYLCETAIIERASNAGTIWLTKEEVTEQWKLSATYQAFIANPKFKLVPAYAKAVSLYSDLITKLAGKTSSYKESDLDLMLAKLNESDLDTTLGNFIVRRVAALKAKGQEVDVDAADLL